ncbi:MAG TPA: fasciclin domain-containing protein [Allosphingosinicella sp.]|nr:fasciclin domain-containing protein [Allosphingosinicella sp.]
MRRALLAAALLLAACGQEDGNNAAGIDTNGTSPQPAAAKGELPKSNILEALTGSADHKTLANAVQAAGLTETFSGAQPYTLFAPTEAAFEKLPPGEANSLLAPEAKGRLVALITGHVVPGVVTAADLGRAIDRGSGKAELATVGGSKLSFGRDGEAIVITDAAGGRARIVRADGLRSNGVVHSIDSVLRSR